MKFIGVVFFIMPALPLAASQEHAPQNQVALATIVPGNPLMQLPGMRPIETPSMTAINPPLPTPLISDVSNAPNPFDSRRGGMEGQTRISYVLTRDASVRITMYDLLGFRVRRWDFPAGQPGGRGGENAFMWDGTNETGQKVSKGGYLAQIEIETPDTVVTVVRKIGVIH